ncbi:hypothetical protein ACF0H5_002887 [Mactra antiquata]
MMIKSRNLMVPRSVKQKAKNPVVKRSHNTSNTQVAAINDEKQLNPDTVHQVLKDVVNKASEIIEEKSSDDKPKSSKPARLTLSEAISMQRSVPYVDVGAVSYDNKVPVYVRSRNSSQRTGSYGNKCYNDVSWEPEHGSRRRRGSRGPPDRYKQVQARTLDDWTDS